VDDVGMGLQAPRSQRLPAGHLGSARAREANALKTTKRQTPNIASRRVDRHNIANTVRPHHALVEYYGM
jgi:spore coat protein CotF